MVLYSLHCFPGQGLGSAKLSRLPDSAQVGNLQIRVNNINQHYEFDCSRQPTSELSQNERRYSTR